MNCTYKIAMYKRLLIFFLLLKLIPVSGQEYMYVNTDNLILRDRPERVYNVFAILHAPSRLKIEPYEDGYKNDRAVTGKFYRVSISYKDERGIGHYSSGWVVKKYLVRELDSVTMPGADKSLDLLSSEPLFEPYMGDDKHNPNNGNAGRFRAPVFKGGEVQPMPVKRVYHTGSRDGCYYMGSKGKKVYVDSKYCKTSSPAR